mgnify:CR=1 FL=1
MQSMRCKLYFFAVLSCATQPLASRAPAPAPSPAPALAPAPCADSAVPSVSEEDRKRRFFMLDEIRIAEGSCFEILKDRKAATDKLGYMPDGPWADCLEKAVDYEEKNKAWMNDVRFSGKGGPQGPAGQVLELFAERVVETQIHLEDCLQSLEGKKELPAQRVEKLALSFQEPVPVKT